MATVVYKSAKILVEGNDISAELNELNTTYGVEVLDVTTFGQDTRVHKGGLSMATIDGAGYTDYALLAANLLYTLLASDDAIVAVWPNGITEGSATGFMMKSVESDIDVLAGPVGSLLAIKFSFEGRGIEA